MLKKITVLLITFLLVILSVGRSYAHVLESSGSVGAVMHITPDDAPVAGGRSDFFFEFKDKKNKFDPKKCNCTVIISEGGKEIFSAALFSNNPSPSLDNASFSFTFPKKDVYAVRITGKPLDGSAFEPFTLTYDIRVEKEAENLSTAGQDTEVGSGKNWVISHIPHIVGGVISLLILALVVKKKSFKK